MQIVIFGDSHAVAIGRGIVSLKERGELCFDGKISVLKIFSAPRTGREFCVAADDRIFIESPEFPKLLGKPYISAVEDKDTTFACTIGFTTTKWFRFEMWKRYTLLPSLAGKTGKQFVSEAVVEKMFLHYNRHVVAFYGRLKKIGISVFAVAAPPPQPADPAVAEGGLDPKEIALISAVSQRALADELRKIDVPCVTVPMLVFTPDGFLKPEFAHEREDDHHHGNEAFGALMARAIIDKVKQSYIRVPASET